MTKFFREAIRHIVMLFTSLLLITCSEDENAIDSVITEDVLYTSGETVRLSGRILSLQSSLSSHGFLIDTTESFSNPITVDLGPTNDLGRFVTEFRQLSADSKYFGRSFIQGDNGLIEGNILPFNTLSSSFDDFEPKFGFPNDIVVITGSNFTSDTKVLFGSQEAEVVSIDFESRMSVRVPEPGDLLTVSIEVISGNSNLQSVDNFEYITGKWVEETTFFNDQLYSESISLLVGSEIYFGLGKDALGNLNPNVWSFDLNSFEWQPLPFATLGRYPFVVDNYFGNGGIDFVGKVFSNEFWTIEGDNFISLPSTPFSLYQSIAADTDEKLFVLGGKNTDNSSNLFVYAFDKVSNEWTIYAEAPFSILNPLPHFQIGSSFYVLNVEDNMIWKFDLETTQWEPVINSPSLTRNGGLAFIIEGRVYLGLFDLDDQLWELDLENSTWLEKINYAGSKGDSNNGFVVYDSKLFLFKIPFAASNEDAVAMKVWSFDPFDL